MDISIYFQPLDKKFETSNYQGTQLGHIINSYITSFPETGKAQIALIGVEEDRNSVDNEGCANAPDQVRKYLYKLFHGSYSPNIIDLGNIKKGHSVEDTYFAVSSAIESLVKKNIVPVIIGGGQDITYANFTAYQKLEQLVNIVSVDNTFDLGEVDQPLDSKSFLSKIILHQPNFLFNYSNIGYQTYLVDQNALDLMSKLYFDSYRLGFVHANIEEVEPIVRNADILSFDISSIRFSDAPGNALASPNGFYGEEACQIVRYAGLSDKLSSIGFYEINPLHDRNGQTSHLVAQMIWCFIDGYYNRKKDFPVANKSEFVKYRVSIQDNKHEIVFYKSPKSDRWWMDVPYPQDKNQKYERHHMVPCSYTDYQTACREDMPDRWWQTFQKLS
jgi:arginase family enzyme